VLAYLDDDDQWDPDHLLILFNQMRSHGARVAYSAYAIWDKFDPDSRLGAGFKAIRFAPFSRSFLENTNYISPVAFIHERALLAEVGPFDPSLIRHVDWDLFLRMTEVERPVAVPCILGHSFQDRAAGGAADFTDKDHYLLELRSKLAERSDWSQPFATADGAEHLAISIGRQARKVRRGRLSTLPVEPVQIVIPNYESRDELEMCLRSIAEHTASPYEILIVDNGSSKETYADLARLPLSFENVHLIREEASSGFSFAVNRGLNEVLDKNEQVLILNNDTLVTPDWLDELRYVLFKYEDVGMAVPRQVLPANSKASRYQMPGASSRFECDINLSAHHNNILDLDFDTEDGLIELSYAPLFCGLFRPETLKALGGLDSGNGPHYRSDWILCDGIRRLLKQRIVYTPHSKIYHLQGVATRKRKSSDGSFLKQRSTKPQTS
jgi:GT2 family glycosyltransferase